MDNVIKQYTKDGVTIVWEPSKCQHSKRCWQELAAVFQPKNKPWINMDGADAASIISQVERCPSGALTYVKNDPA